MKKNRTFAAFSEFSDFLGDILNKATIFFMRYSYYVLLLATLLVSCIKSEPENKECDILEAWVEGENLDQYFSQKTDMRIENIPSSSNLITFTVRNRSALPAMALHFKLTPGATVTPANGSIHDFSQEPVTYTVTSEDGNWKRTYQVDFREGVQPTNSYDFDDYELSANNKYYVWFYKDDNGTKNYIWASGNEGYMVAKPSAPAEDYPTVPDDNGFDGKCIRLTTRSTGNWGKTFKKPIAAGNFYLGAFDVSYAFTNTLMCTQMGIPYTQEPVKITGYYKYAPGPVFTDKNFNELPDRVDLPSLYSVLYYNHDEAGGGIMLHGDDVLSSPYIVRKAEVLSAPATDQWTKFEMTFQGSTPIDAELLANRGYNLALVFSSSKTGDTFEGAVGSTLYIDKVEITFKSGETKELTK